MKMKWEDYFDKNILDRGFAYYNNHEIISIKKTKNKVSAEVSGSETYHVKIDLDDLSSMSCTCPHFLGGNKCKHLAAVMFAVSEGVEEEVVEEVLEEEEYDIERMVDECDELFLRYFLSEVIKENKNVRNQFIEMIPSIYIHKK